MEYIQYLKNKIAEFRATHAQLEEEKTKHTDSDLLMAYSSQAASVWDLKCEMEKALLQFEASNSQKMVHLLVDATNELLFIVRNNDNLNHTGQFSRIMNESREAVEGAYKNGFLNHG